MKYGAALLAFLASITYIPQIIGAGTSGRWAILAVGIPLLLCFKRGASTPGHRWMVAGLLYATLSLLWTPSWPDGVQGVAELAILTGAWFLGSAIEGNARLVYLALGIGMTLSAACSPFLDGSLFVNVNVAAEASVASMILTIPFAWPLAIGPALFIAFLSKCRAALLALGIVAMIALRPRFKWAGFTALALALVWVFFSSPHAPDGRWELWAVAARALTFFGNGIGSVYSIYPSLGDSTIVELSDGARPVYLHNEPLHFLFELGIGAIPIFLAFIYALRGPLENERLALVGIFVVALFGFPLHMPLTVFIAGFVAGRNARARDDLRRIDNVWSGYPGEYIRDDFLG